MVTSMVPHIHIDGKISWFPLYQPPQQNASEMPGQTKT